MAGQYKKRFGDRKEGRRLRSLAPFYKLVPYIMRETSDACNYFQDSVEITAVDRWIRQKRAEGFKGMGVLHLFIAAYIRTVAMRPALNRFIAGQKIYARRNIEVIMAVKPNLSSESDETSIKIKFAPTDTVFDVYHKFNAAVDEVKANEGANGTDNTAAALCKLPGLLLKFAIWFLNLLDYFDFVPQSLLDVSPFHGSIVVTDLGSLGIPPVFHHIYNFGNIPAFLAFGSKRRAAELDKNGALTERKYVDYNVTLDERICDGYYFATALKYMKYYLKNPEQLELPPERVERDVF